MYIKNITKISPQLGLALSFFTAIFLGAVLLSLPISSVGHSTSFLDALFTATSATCVTGLIVVDTGTHWTLFGHIVILVLIQFGGIGIMTFTSLIILIFARRLSLWDRDIMEQSVAADRSQPLSRVLIAVFLLTFVFELIGATILTWRFAAHFELGKAAFLGLFHAISAFCNAGFSLFTTNLMDYQADLIINVTTMLLIILGGIGFWVLFDLKNIVKHKRYRHSTTLHTRLVLHVSLILIVLGATTLLLLEWQHAFRGMPNATKLTAAFFHAVSARTAGFNTIDLTRLTNSSLFLLSLLMFIGASPGSCGGGVKTSTFAILLAMIFARLKNQKQVRLYHRGVPESAVAKAIGITAAGLLIISLFSFFLLITENAAQSNIPERTLFIEVLFETVSAFGTVGLSMGLTTVLSPLGKVFIILLMYIGRLGPITLTLALAGVHQKNMRYAEENVWVG